MNILLWILQGLLALHTAVGAIWKVSNSEQTVPSLSAIPHSLWLALIAVELLAALGLILPALSPRRDRAAPLGATVIAAEMLIFCVLHFSSGQPDSSPLAYWLVVAAIAIFIAFGRLVLRPLR
jgi:hypothetical protein